MQFVKKIILLLPVLIFSATTLFAQDDELPPPSSKPKTDYPEAPPVAATPDTKNFQGFSKPKKVDFSKFIIEPDFNFGIVSNEIDLGLSPYVGYKVWKELYLGGGVTYFYSGFRNIPFQLSNGSTVYANANWHTFGGGVFAQYNIWKGFFARTRFEVLHRVMDDFYDGNVTVTLNPQSNSYQVNIPKVQATIPACLIGVGYNLLRSKNFFFPILVSYNVLYSVTNQNYSIYPHGWVVQLGFVNIF
jgi:hypothetical protein